LDGTLVSLTRQGVDFVSLIHPKASRKLTDRDSAIDTDDSHGLYKNAERSLTGIRLIEETDELKVRNKRGRVNKSFSDSEFLEENLSNNSSEVDEDQSYIDASLFEYLTQGVGTCGTIILFLLILVTQVSYIFVLVATVFFYIFLFVAYCKNGYSPFTCIFLPFMKRDL
jgi:hypothetical protein